MYYLICFFCKAVVKWTRWILIDQTFHHKNIVSLLIQLVDTHMIMLRIGIIDWVAKSKQRYNRFFVEKINCNNGSIERRKWFCNDDLLISIKLIPYLTIYQSKELEKKNFRWSRSPHIQVKNRKSPFWHKKNIPITENAMLILNM
jgi:hypothetical protein